MSHVFRQMRRAIVSASPRRMARIFGDFAQRVPDIMNCRDDQGRFVCKQYFPEHQHILTQQVPVVRTVSLARDDCKQPLIGDRSTQIVQENGQQC